MNKNLILLLERLELYISAGLTLDKALEIAGQGSPKKQKISLGYVRQDILSGGLLSKSLIKNLKISKTLSGLIEHGESSGELLRALNISRTMLEKQGEALRKCTSALVYPGIIAVFASFLTIGLVRRVMPQITPMLRGLNIPLPLLTRIVMTISENLMSYGLYIGGSIFVVVLLLFFSYRKVRSVRFFCQNVMIRLPIVGKLVFSYSLSLFLQSFGSLIESGIPLPRAYRSTVDTLSLWPLQEILRNKIQEIDKGLSCGSVFAEVSRRIPIYVPSLLSAGEASGALGSSLLRAASLIDRDLDHGLKRLTSLIEPVMMIGLGCTVGSIALSIMMPIYDISKVLQH